MYSRCIACHSKLGKNQALEWFPVGRTVAFDPERGRLWVICRRCRTWNLVPLLERWEAIQELQRRFEGAVVEATSENVALARLADGTAVLRIGKAARPELAIWRYADRLVGRWRRSSRIGWVAAGGTVAVGLGTGLGILNVALVVVVGGVGVFQVKELRPVARLKAGSTIRRGDARKLYLHTTSEAPGWSLKVSTREAIEGDEAVRVLRRILPRINRYGGEPEQVRSALARVRAGASSGDVVSMIAGELGHEWNIDPKHNPLALGDWGPARPGRISTTRPELRLALEMAVNEEVERRALAGEMWLLEREWEEAEALASISDDLLIPPSVDAWIRRQKSRHRP